MTKTRFRWNRKAKDVLKQVAQQHQNPDDAFNHFVGTLQAVGFKKLPCVPVFRRYFKNEVYKVATKAAIAGKPQNNRVEQLQAEIDSLKATLARTAKTLIATNIQRIEGSNCSPALKSKMLSDVVTFTETLAKQAEVPSGVKSAFENH